MNERIKELALKAGFRQYDAYSNLYSPHNGDMELNDELKEFAKLIIQECIDTMKEHSYNTSMLLSHPPKSSAVWDACNAIEKKFGVK